MVDLGFEEDIREIMSFFKGQRQMLMFRCAKGAVNMAAAAPLRRCSGRQTLALVGS